MKFAAVALVALAAVSFAACDSKDSRNDASARDEVAELSGRAQQASFSIDYALATNTDEGDEAFDIALVLKPRKLLLRIGAAGEAGTVYFAGGEEGEGTFCQVAEDASGETVCATSEDETGMSGLLLAFYLPGLALFDQAEEQDVSIEREDDRVIAGVEAACYEFKGDTVDSGFLQPAIGCFGPDGEPLYHLAMYEDDRLEFTATGVRYDVAESDLEVPHRIVEQDILPQATCVDADCDERLD
jgi:hypothetical protein